VAPPTTHKFAKNLKQRGGGLVLECQYFLSVSSGVSSERVLQEVKDFVAKMKGNETVSVTTATELPKQEQQHQHQYQQQQLKNSKTFSESCFSGLQ
jgi:hypothetical protein